jgi:cell wall-associated NlpC family hydrolase
MLEEIRTALGEVAQRYGDTRVQHCQVAATGLNGERCTLSGTVLDGETQAVLTNGLSVRFPEIRFDAQEVRVLRPGRRVTVGTNVTSLHAEASFRAEMMSQLLSGWTVELLLERDRWAYVRQADGYLGWTYRPYLVEIPAPDPTHIVCAPLSLLRTAPEPGAALVSRVAGGTAVQATAAEGGWARLELAGGQVGWVPATDLRPLGALPQEDGARRQQMVQDGQRLTGVPYLWGGSTALGIDCSGLVQLVHRLAGLTIPRDADMQYAAGRRIEPPFRPGDLLFFGGEGGGRSITHVGMSVGGWHIAHASRARNGVYEDDVQAVTSLRESFAGARTFLGD